jgi:hypothetical protein
VDVARFGDDKNIVVSYAGRTARLESSWSGVDTTSSAHHVLRVAEEIRDRLEATWTEIRVDAVGLGAGVVDTLNARRALLPQPWFDVYEMHGSAAPPQDVGGSVQGYGNARAYWFDQLRQSVRNGSVKLEECDAFRDDLAVVLYRYKPGRLFILSKEDMRKMIGRSPDVADALVYATAPVSGGLLMGDVVQWLRTPLVMAALSPFGTCTGWCRRCIRGPRSFSSRSACSLSGLERTVGEQGHKSRRSRA